MGESTSVSEPYVRSDEGKEVRSSAALSTRRVRFWLAHMRHETPREAHHFADWYKHRSVQEVTASCNCAFSCAVSLSERVPIVVESF